MYQLELMGDRRAGIVGEMLEALLWAGISIAIAGSPIWLSLARDTATFAELVVANRITPVTIGLAASSAVMVLSSKNKSKGRTLLNLVVAGDLVVVIFANSITDATVDDAFASGVLLGLGAVSVAAARFILTIDGGRR